MIEDVFAGIFAVILGLALVTYIAVLARKAARYQRELTRRRGGIASQEQLESYIRKIDQALSEDDIDRLDNERRDSG